MHPIFLVGAHQENYFADKASFVEQVFVSSASQDQQIQVANGHDNMTVFTPEMDAMLPLDRLVGRRVKPFNDSIPGQVDKYLARKELFVMKYWKDPSCK
jgi:hypothetical protein